MLIISRRIDETIMIGDDITITVLGIERNQVKLGISAPRNVSVHREEIYDKIQDELVVDKIRKVGFIKSKKGNNE